MNNNLDPHNFLLLLVLVLFLVSNSIIPSQCEEPTHYSCGANKATPQISKTIDNLLPTLVNLTYKDGSTTTTSDDKNVDPIYALAQCRGDVPNGPCSDCIKNAIKVIRLDKYCPTQSDAQIWYDYCFLRYSNSSFFGDVQGSGLILVNGAKVTHSEDYNGKLTALMANITLEAVGSENGMGEGKSVLSTNDTLYALLQCNKDLMDPKYARCGQCLTMATRNLNTSKACRNHEGCRVLYSSCYLRTELYPFFYNGTSGVSSRNYEERVVKDVIKT